MSEYAFVEKPFLQQLAALGWKVIEQSGIPRDPAPSFRNDFREVVLTEIFKESVKRINTDGRNREWLTDKQCEDILSEVLDQHHKGLIEANRDVFNLIIGGGEHKIVMDNEASGERALAVRLVDFDRPERNSFIAIEQFRVDTPGTAKEFIIPDIVLFVNGLPLVVVECKYPTEITSNAMYEGIRQLLRYCNRRRYLEGIADREGDERLFWFNQIIISTFGDEARFASVTAASEEHFLEWKDIHPEEYRTYNPPLGKERSQEVLIQGMLPPATLLDIVRSFIVFKEAEGKTLIKVLCRYQQYRAVHKALQRMLTARTPEKRSGVIWHTQGSGKSLTMVFLVRKMRYIRGLSDYKILMVNDRIDLEDQLTETARLTGETVIRIDSADKMKAELAKDDSVIAMVMIHKFFDRERDIPDYLRDIIVAESRGEYTYAKDDLLPEYKLLDVVNDSEKILILIDEAHRTQSSLLNLNMFNAFPASTKIAFTGTPLIADRHTKKTHDTFGTYIDKYKLQDAVNDGATLSILYEGRTEDAAISHKAEFDRKFEDLFKDRTAKEIEMIKKKYGTYGDILESDRYIEEIAKDLVDHYTDFILPNGFKAQVVASSQIAAVRYKKFIDIALAKRLEKEKASDTPDASLIKLLAFIRTAVVISGQGTNEAPEITKARKDARAVDAIDSFKRKIDFNNPNTGVAILIVCDMLLTGFDAPVEQVMYINKKIREHNLLQAIARVNRTSKGKEKGYIVDYIGIGNHLKAALEIYASDDREDILNAMKDLATEIPVLQDRYQRLVNLFKDHGVDRIEDYVQFGIKDPNQQFDILERAVEIMADIKLRASFDIYLKNYLKSLDVVFPNPISSRFVAPAKAFGHIHNRVRNRYKDESLSLGGVGQKVKRLIDEHLVSLGINPVVPPVELLSKDFKMAIAGHKSKKAAASEMEHAIRKHIKVNLDYDPAYYQKMSEKLENILRAHHDDIDVTYKSLLDLYDEIKAGRKEGVEGLDAKREMPFYDLLVKIAFDDVVDDHASIDELAGIVRECLNLISRRIRVVDFWGRPTEQDELKRELRDILLFSGNEKIIASEARLVIEFINLAKRKRDELAR